eukprot:TRINITY_DN1720_c0_g1_i1.p1 TRINITY_DN1720_c0_g1~~TRINITY_DN1720_c0_g1_i1.p1  ORF type:complete len:159 (-),score=46.53 TRINITY_DN1720_c0_g1_i1:527-1003(-)
MNPLGILAPEEIDLGRNLLDQIAYQIPLGNRKVLTDLSNKYYTAIPHGFGRKRPPVIDDQNLLEQERHLLRDMYSDHVWQYECERQGWTDFDSNASQQLEELYRRRLMHPEHSNERTKVHSGEWEYMIDFDRMIQTNTEHQEHRERNIRRIHQHQQAQ